MPTSASERFDYVWWFRKFRGDRKGHRCRVLARGRGGQEWILTWGWQADPGMSWREMARLSAPRNVLVEFEDGERVVGTRFCVRRLEH